MPERKRSSLPAFTCVGAQADLWPEAPGLSYSAANQVGRDRAVEMVEVIRRTESPTLLGHVVEAIMKRGQFGGVEIGFFHGLAEELLTPMALREFVEVPRGRQIPALAQLGHLRLVG